MARGTDNSRTQILIAIIGLAGVILAAVIANWDKIFPGAAPPEAAATANQAAPAGAAPGILPVGGVERQAAAQERTLNASTEALDDIAAKIEAANANNH